MTYKHNLLKQVLKELSAAQVLIFTRISSLWLQLTADVCGGEGPWTMQKLHSGPHYTWSILVMKALQYTYLIRSKQVVAHFLAKQSLLLCLIKRVKEGFRKYQGCHEFNYSTSVVFSCDNDALIVQLVLHVSELLDILHERGILHVLRWRGTVENITRLHLHLQNWWNHHIAKWEIQIDCLSMCFIKKFSQMQQWMMGWL